MLKKFFILLLINILLVMQTYALPIGFLLLWWESLLFLCATLSTIFFSILFYFKKLSFLNKFILFITISLIFLIWYLIISEKYYKYNTSLDKITNTTDNNFLP
jgi:hypothetical protein